MLNIKLNKYLRTVASGLSGTMVPLGYTLLEVKRSNFLVDVELYLQVLK